MKVALDSCLSRVALAREVIITAAESKIRDGRLVDETSLGFACGAVEALLDRDPPVARGRARSGVNGGERHGSCEIDGRGVASVTLNRPRVNNAYNGALIDALIETFERLGRDPAVRAVVLRGAGRHFQAGADLAFLDRLRTVSAEENREFSRRTVAAFRAVQLCPRPTIALIHGGCFGGGVGIAAACDIAIAAEDAVFALTEVRWGITPAPIIPLLVDRIGARMTGRSRADRRTLRRGHGARDRPRPRDLPGRPISKPPARGSSNTCCSPAPKRWRSPSG